MKDIRQSKEYADYLSSIGWEVGRVQNQYYFVKSILGFKTIKFQRPEKIDKQIIRELGQKYKGIINLLIEPSSMKHHSLLIDSGFKITTPSLPSKTLFLDLSKSKNDIFDSFSKDARYAIRKADKSDIKISKTTDLELFWKSWKRAVPSSRYVMPLKHLKALQKAFGKKCLFLLAEDNSAGGIFLVANDIGYYWHGFSDNKARKDLLSYKIVWDGIAWAKKNGAKYFDFEGIYDARFPLEKWKGFSKFKKKFGGVEVEYPGVYRKIFLNF